MITIGNKKYAKNNNEFTDSLFKSGGTCDGFYKVYENRIIFKDMQGKPFACLVANDDHSPYFVCCSKLDNGKIYFMYGINSFDLKKLGIRLKDSVQVKDEDEELHKLNGIVAGMIWKNKELY
jgi:hypothetical protein